MGGNSFYVVTNGPTVRSGHREGQTGRNPAIFPVAHATLVPCMSLSKNPTK